MRWQPGLLAVLAVAALAWPAGRSGADEKDKEKDKAQAKAKPAPRTYSDEDLKKYKDAPKEAGSDAQAGSGGSAASEEARAAAPVPRRRPAREYGSTYQGNQEQEPTPPPSSTAPAPTEPSVVETPPVDEPSNPEEADWKRRAAQARNPVNETKGRIAQIDAEIAELKDRLNPMSINYLLGGNSTAGPDAVYEVEEKLRNLDTQRIDASAELLEAEKGWQRFLEEARAAGASSAWLNP